MLRLNKFFIFSIFALFSFVANAKNCSFKIEGQIFDSNTQKSLPFAHICNNKTQECFSSNFDGYFNIENNSCDEKYSFSISFIGYESKNIVIKTSEDTVLKIFLDSEVKQINEVIVHKEKRAIENQIQLSKENISANGEKNLANILESIQGVSVLKTGTGNSKPIIQGLYGNRISIVNQGIVQSGQQWGNDHSPEIDPFTANKISVIKGSNVLAYGGNALGGVIKLEQKSIAKSERLLGAANYIFQSNGLGHTLNIQLEKYNKILPFRINASLKLIGDQSTPNYFLTNTGKREGSFSLLFEKKISHRLKTILYYSYITAKIGVLRGSHIGNLSDLKEALERDIPFYTKDNFSYQINSPKQNVQHHLLKSETKYLISESQYLNFKYGFQLNDRKEFDVRRANFSKKPALGLLKLSHDVSLEHHKVFSRKINLKTGLQYHIEDNTNNPETGIFPLIPDYISQVASAYSILNTRFEKISWNAGFRYDFKNYNVAAISKTLPRKIERFDMSFNTYSLATAMVYHFSDAFNLGLDIAYIHRAPAINELFSFGLHQGVSGLEEGRSDLKTEKSLKFLLTSNLKIGNKLQLENQSYFQNIDDFIYLQASNTYRLTIRGAFPVFEYKQTHAQLYGSDFSIQYDPMNRISFRLKYSIIRANNLNEKLALVNMPSDNFRAKVIYQFKDNKSFKNIKLNLNAFYNFKQNQISEEQDFLSPPESYFLLGIGYSNQFVFKQSKLTFAVSIDNLLNRQYRDYLNRQRYYADETGINAKIRLSYTF